MRRSLLALVASLCLAFSGACSHDPETSRDEHLGRGDAFLAQKKLNEAVLEYRLAVEADQRSAIARQKLAEAYLVTNEPRGAMAEYVRAADLAPTDATLQLRAGQLLVIAGRFEDAKTRAEQALALQPNNVEALVLKGNAFAGLKNLDQAFAEMETAIRTDPGQSIGYSSMGLLQLSKGNLVESEAAFNKAVSIQPNDINARMALANLYWASNRKAEAEKALRSALEVEPKNILANQALAMVLIGTGRRAEAEAPVKTIAENASGPSGWMGLADYYVSAGRLPEARATLEKLATDPATSAMAKLRLASLALQGGDRAGAGRLVDEALAKEPKNVQALVGKANFQVSDGRLDDALATVRTALQLDPGAFQAHYQHGVILAAKHQYDEAVNAHKSAIQARPEFAPSSVELARLALQAGRPAEAVKYAQAAIQAVPSYVNGHLLLARAELASGNVKAAEVPLALLAKNFPHLPVVQVEVGRMFAARGEDARARTAFEAALRTEPANSGAVEGLASLDVKQKRPDAARARVQAAIKAAPNDTRLHVLAARTYATTGDEASAETELKRAISIDPNHLAAYQLLASLYARQRKLPQAAAEFQKVAERQPRSIYAHTAVGLMMQLQNKLPEAMQSYERALAINPNAAIAANNLAQIYADRDEKLDIALQLAQTAKSALPRSHEVDDTLGWVYYKRKLSDMAIASFKQCVAADPKNAVYLYHLGLAYAQNGNRAQARETLEKALQIQPDFAGADDARRVLQTLRG